MTGRSERPQQIGPYRILETLGEGGMGTVYLAEQQEPVQRVATATGGYRRWVEALVLGSDRKLAEKQLANDLLLMSLSYSRGFSDGSWAAAIIRRSSKDAARSIAACSSAASRASSATLCSSGPIPTVDHGPVASR